MKTVSLTRLTLSLLSLLMFASFTRAEIQDGGTVPDAPRDQEKARTWTVSGEERFYLPTLKEGPGKGYFAFYESRYYRAGVTEDGGLEIQMIDRDGKELSKKFELGGPIRGYYDVTDKNKKHKHVPRYMIGLKEEMEPQEQPRNKLVIEAKLEENAEFRRTYEFDRDEITVVTGLDCDRKNQQKTKAWMGASFPALMSFDRNTPQAEREKALEGHKVVMRTYEGKRRKTEEFPYAKSDFYRGITDLIEIWGPWGEDRPLILKTKDEVMRPHNYSGKCPYEGYWVRIHVPHDTLRSYDYKLDIQFRD